MNKNEIQSVIALLDNADKQIEGLTPKKANALLICVCEDAVSALREALTKQPAQQQEPVAWLHNGKLHEVDPSDWATGTVTPLYKSPPARKPWVGLTDEEVKREWEIWRANAPRYVGFAIGIEAKLKEKNFG